VLQFVAVIDVISIWRLYLPGVEPGISRWLVGISTATPWMLSSADESSHGVAVEIPTNHREIPGSTPGRYNLQIEITSKYPTKRLGVSGTTVSQRGKTT